MGAVIKKINPVYSDDRGIITDVLNENIGHVGIITCNLGSTRGNHYHKKSVQYSYILSGKFEVLIADLKNLDDVEKFYLVAGDLITISPETVHTFKAVEDSVMIDMISQSREGSGYEDDVVKGIVLKQ